MNPDMALKRLPRPHLRRRVRFFSIIELVNALELEKEADKQGPLTSRLVAADLVIL